MGPLDVRRIIYNTESVVRLEETKEKWNVYNEVGKLVCNIYTLWEAYAVRCQIKCNSTLKDNEYYTFKLDSDESITMDIDRYGRTARHANGREHFQDFEKFLNCLM